MKGARKYALLFKTGQYGKLYITSGNHARGRTFRIQILKEGEIAKPNGDGNCCINNGAVIVYGVTGGVRGWTETYGWLHEGKWQEDFEKLVTEKRTKISFENEKYIKQRLEEEKAEEDHINKTLIEY